MVLRAHYTCLQWKSSHIPSPQLPNPNDFGWNWNQDEKIYEPLMTTNHPAPDSITERSVCRCKTGCKSGRCQCHKNNLLCSEMCLCENCTNCENEFDGEFETDDEDERHLN